MIDFKDKKVLIPFLVLGSLLFLFIVLQIAGRIISTRNHSLFLDYIQNQKIDARELQQITSKNKIIKKRIGNLTPRGMYIIIDTTSNTLYIKKGNQIKHKAMVSCGSGSILNEPGGKRRWVFDTPKGAFVIQSKLRNPIWLKPDWAFIEEGENIPKEATDRLEEGVLGEYALGFGDGYFIHGTLYSRMLGKNVTHGCIRLGDEDLRTLFRSISIGNRLYIY